MSFIIIKQVEFYVTQTKADNHAVREAACACIAELGTKVGLIVQCRINFNFEAVVYHVIKNDLY